MKERQFDYMLEAFEHDEQQEAGESVLSGNKAFEDVQTVFQAGDQRTQQLAELYTPLPPEFLSKIDERVGELLRGDPGSALPANKLRDEPRKVPLFRRLRYALMAVPVAALATFLAVLALNPASLPEYDGEFSDPLAGVSDSNGNPQLGPGPSGEPGQLPSTTLNFRSNACIQVLLRPSTRLPRRLANTRLQVSAYFLQNDHRFSWSLPMEQASTGTLHTREPCVTLPAEVGRGDWQIVFFVGTQVPKDPTPSALREAASSSPKQPFRSIVRQVHID